MLGQLEFKSNPLHLLHSDRIFVRLMYITWIPLIMCDEAAPLHSPLDPDHSGDEGSLKEINNIATDGSEIESLVSEIWSTRMNCSNINRWGDPYKSALFSVHIVLRGWGSNTVRVFRGVLSLQVFNPARTSCTSFDWSRPVPSARNSSPPPSSPLLFPPSPFPSFPHPVPSPLVIPPSSLLEMIIWTDWPLVNDRPEGPASYK